MLFSTFFIATGTFEIWKYLVVLTSRYVVSEKNRILCENITRLVPLPVVESGTMLWLVQLEVTFRGTRCHRKDTHGIKRLRRSTYGDVVTLKGYELRDLTPSPSADRKKFWTVSKTTRKIAKYEFTSMTGNSGMADEFMFIDIIGCFVRAENGKQSTVSVKGGERKE